MLTQKRALPNTPRQTMQQEVTWALSIALIALFQFVVCKGNGKTTAQHDPKAFLLRDAFHLQRKLQHAATGLIIYAVS
jgi:hypothetical protein